MDRRHANTKAHKELHKEMHKKDNKDNSVYALAFLSIIAIILIVYFVLIAVEKNTINSQDSAGQAYTANAYSDRVVSKIYIYSQPTTPAYLRHYNTTNNTR